MELPYSERINVAALSSCFKNVTNSYKFFWLWSIIDTIEDSPTTFISYEDLSLRMLSLAWYPLDYFKLSFGKQDGFKLLASKISSFFTIDNSVNSKPLLTQIKENLDEIHTQNLIKEVTEILKRYVSCRFLSSFFSQDLLGVKDYKVNGIIKELSNSVNYIGSIPYSIKSDGITINSLWLKYFKTHHYILKGFIKWYLLNFLQKNNPNVIGLSEKLEKPIIRDLKMAKKFWRDYIATNPTKCIYSKTVISIDNLSLDHFIPWSYVAHDLLWNIVPTIRSINSAKRDYLPSLEKYFLNYCQLQYNAISYCSKYSKINFLEDYSTLLNLSKINELSYESFKNILLLEIENNIRNATNIGFQYPFVYKL